MLAIFDFPAAAHNGETPHYPRLGHCGQRVVRVRHGRERIENRTKSPNVLV
jgi:hypothetical protein